MAVLSYLDADPSKRNPMTKERADTFLRCVLLEQSNKKLFAEEEAEKCGAIGKIFWHRLQLQGPVQVRLGLALFVITALTDGVPGKVVMWAYTLNRMFKKKAESIGGELSMDDLAFCFPVGFPNEEEQLRLWDAQKGYNHGNPECDNMVDQMNTWVLE